MIKENVSVYELNLREDCKSRTIIDRYVLISDYCKGKTILSLGCGYGYGEMILKALGSKKIVGIDKDTEAIKWINQSYKAYMTGICKDLETNEIDLHNTFDVVIAMECLEHIEEKNVSNFFDIIRRHVKPTGTIIISTPIKKKETNDELHHHEYELMEFGALLQKEFPNTKIGFNLLGEFVMSREGFYDDQVTFRVRELQYAKTMVGLVIKKKGE